MRFQGNQIVLETKVESVCSVIVCSESCWTEHGILSFLRVQCETPSVAEGVDAVDGALQLKFDDFKGVVSKPNA